ncbi:MAG: type II toxin-antitoxin system RatA family toxin [Proteobacteria bacterium]|nr:type II toxin-antitoxin system RatA family toxin [Pseudomonadota bacterium]
MYNINRSALVPYSSQKMFDLVNDVENYKNYLPWCGGSEVIEESENTSLASITIAFKGVHKSFTTANKLTRHTEIRIAMVDGPFSKLEGIWTFKALEENACKLSVDLDFDFSSRIVGAVIGPVFKIIADSMIDSFCKRAQEIYGEGCGV